MKVTIIGVGGLGGALARGLLASSSVRGGGGGGDVDDPVALTLCARRPGSLDAFAPATSATSATTNAPTPATAKQARLTFDPREAVAGADVVVLAVKPKGTPELLAHVTPALAEGAVVVSCAAGVPLARLVGPPAVARAMPNIGAQVGASTTALCFGAGCLLARDRPRLVQVFSAVGAVREVVDEGWLHVVTAVGASGPAFLLLACEALADGAVAQGLPRAEALAWARAALVAAAARLDDGVEPQLVRAQVTSPAGTTAAGVAALEGRAVRAGFLEAVAAAVARSREL